MRLLNAPITTRSTSPKRGGWSLKPMTRSKSGQFYILTSIILIIYLFTVTSPSAGMQKPTTAFKELYENYLTESGKTVNLGINEGNLTTRYMNFSEAYMAYALTRVPEFRLAYALLDQDKIVIVNTLGEPLNATSTEQSIIIQSGTHTTVNKTENITFYLTGIQYNFGFTKDTEVKLLFKKSAKNEVLIHVEEQG